MLKKGDGMMYAENCTSDVAGNESELQNLSMLRTPLKMNPLLRRQFRIPFDEILPAHVEPAIEAHIAEADAKLRAIVTVKGRRTFQNTMLALEHATDGLSFAYGLIDHIESVATSEAFRAAYSAVEEKISAFYSGIALRQDLWRAIKEYAETKEAKSLTGIKRRFLEKTLKGFERSGADLGPEQKVKLQAMDTELSKLTTKFGQNVLDATNSFELIVTDSSKLSGLPESAVVAAKASAEKKGLEGWRFTLHAPSFTPVLQYADDADFRRTIYEAYYSRASAGAFDNKGLLSSILRLRKEKAELLGYRDFPDYVLEERMAKSGERATTFEADLRKEVEPFAKADHQELVRFRKKLEGPKAPPLEPWDIGYYAEKLRKAFFDFDAEALRPYFPAERVLAGAFELANRLYGITIKPNEDLPGWHPDVRAYSVFDADGTFLGAFYVDLHPRESKRGGAWMNALLTGGLRGDAFEPHLGLLCANITEPVDGRPALLKHSEVETLFHEWGHLLHQLLSRVEIESFGGTKVAWDFVELPSQIMENWCWEREVLDTFAAHYETGEKLPAGLFNKLLAARNFRAATGFMGQLAFGTADLKLHREYDPGVHGDALSYSNQILQEFAVTRHPASYAFILGFTHLFSNPTGYAAAYYSYLWAEVLEADAFSRFKQEGVCSRETGMSFRRAILEKGDSEEPDTLFRDFMGREPDASALLRRSGLITPPGKRQKRVKNTQIA